MWTPEQLDAAQYVAHHEYESRQPLNVGTMEISGANNGTFFMTPVPPFGSLTGEHSGYAGQKMGTHVPLNKWAPAYTPKGLPVPDRVPADQYVIHQYGDGSI
mgnify:FL=1